MYQLWCDLLFPRLRLAPITLGVLTVCGFVSGCQRQQTTEPASMKGPVPTEQAPLPADPQVGQIFPVGPQGQSTSFGIYNTSPESPDGSRIAYLRFLQEPKDPKDGQPGELWVCDADLTHHRKVRDVGRVRPHNGDQVFWGDDETLIYVTPYDAEPPRVLHIVDAETGEDLITPVKGVLAVSHDVWEGKILFATDRRANGTAYRPAGIYELDIDTGSYRPVKLLTELTTIKEDLPESILDSDTLYPEEDWHLLHLMYSPSGKHIAFRLDVGRRVTERLRVVMNADGSDVCILSNRLLHLFFYDDDSLIGHDRREGHEQLPVRYSCDDVFIETLAQVPGNHFAVSPDLEGFASESDYGSDPVVLSYYHKGDVEPSLVLAEFDPQGVIWEKRFHVNPAFSRDGKRLYFHMPTADGRNGTYVAIVQP